MIGELITRASHWFGDEVAVIDGTHQASFKEVEARANRVANTLVAINPTSGTRVGVLLGNRIEFIECDFGIAKAGKVKVPIDPRLVLEERLHILRDSGIDILVTDGESAAEIHERRDELPALEHTICVDTDGPSNYEKLLDKAVDRPPQVAYSPDDISVILYTSGTTGRAKGAAASFRSRLFATRSMLLDELVIDSRDRMIHVAPMSHGSGSKTLAYFLRGAANICERRWDAERFLHHAETGYATTSFLVPTMLAMLLEVAGPESPRTTRLNSITYGGSSIAPDLLAALVRVFGRHFVQVYGSCEAPHPVLVLPKEMHSDDPTDPALRSAGREVVGSSVRLVTADGAEVPDGEIGVLAVGGDNVMTGYWGNEQATDEVFRNGYYETGDLAARDEIGLVSIVGRVRDMIITGGNNVYPTQVEAMLGAHPNIRETAVVGIKDPQWGETVVAYVVPRPDHTLTVDELNEFARTRIANYSVPRRWEIVDALPKGPTGKVLKRKLVERHGEQAAPINYIET